MSFKKRTIQTLVATMVMSGGVLAISGNAYANDSDELEQLRALVQQLDQKVKVLERKNEITEEDTATAKKTTPVVKAGPGGFSFASADGKNEIKFRGLFQADHRHYDEGASDIRGRSAQRAGNLNAEGFHDADDTSLLRRVRPTIEGTLGGKYGFRFTPEFAGGSASAVDAYGDANLTPYFKIRAGKFKSFVGLERLQSGSDIKFVERSYVTNAILPNRDLGIAVSGDFFGNKLNYAVGIVNGVADGGNISTGTSYNGEREYTARLFTTPFADDLNALNGLGFGVGATYTDFSGERNLDFTQTTAADTTRNGLPAYVTNGQQTFFRYGSATVADGRRLRVSPQANYYYGPLGVIAEYAFVHQDVSLLNSTTSANASVVVPNTSKSLSHDAWQIAASYLLTGEDASFKGVKPKQDFDIDKGGWGAWELAARYSELNLDDDTFKNKAGTSFSNSGNGVLQTYADLGNSAKSAKSWTAGLNWYWNQNVKLQLNYELTKFDGGATTNNANANATGSNVKDRPDEKAILARFQVAF